MKKCKTTKKIVSMVVSLIMLFSVTSSVFAAESETMQSGRDYVIVNGTKVVYAGENYENLATGEYIRWDQTARGVDKSFTFKVRYSVTSSKFTVHSDRVLIEADAEVEDLDGVVQTGYSGHLYKVELIGLYSRELQFSVGSSQSGTVSGLDNGGSYKVRITNVDYLPSTKYLVGSGTVSTL